jgi:hypothetical protein
LVGCTPHGQIYFVSEAYGGKTTDPQITTSSSFLLLLEPRNLVLADKGFPQIKTLLNESGRGHFLSCLHFCETKFFTANEVEETQTITSVRIHIESIIQRLKTFHIMSKFTIYSLPYNFHVLRSC